MVPARARPSNREYCYAHTRERLLQRYGVDCTEFEYTVLCKSIASRDGRYARFVARIAKHASAWLVSHRGSWVLVTYNRKNRLVTTALPLSAQFPDPPEA